MTTRELENLAATHSDQCAPTCPQCLARDLQAKAEAVRANTVTDCAAFVELNYGAKPARALREFMRRSSP